MSLRLPDPGSFEDLLRPIRIEVASLVRLSRHPATEPYWSAGVYRFDDSDPGGAGPFGTCYTASTIEVAFAESVIHECGRFVRGSYEVPAAELTERSVVRFVCDRRKTLVLADLTGAALKSLGLNNDISASRLPAKALMDSKKVRYYGQIKHYLPIIAECRASRPLSFRKNKGCSPSWESGSSSRGCGAS